MEQKTGRFRGFVAKHFFHTLRDADRLKGCRVPDDIVFEQNSDSKTFFIKAVIENPNRNSAVCYLQMEKVYSCKECDTIFDDDNEILLSLMETETKTISSGYRCKMCKEGTSRKEDMMKHLQSHLESKEVICEECKEMASGIDINQVATQPEKNLKTVRLLQVAVPCKRCNIVISTLSIILPEVMTVDYNLNDSDQEMEHTCCECNCDLTSIINNYYKENAISQTQPICEECQEINPSKEKDLMVNRRISKTCSIGSSSNLSCFPMRQPVTRRHIMITNINQPLQIKRKDFIAEHKYTESGVTWYTCRFCGQALTNELEVTHHVSGHVSFHKIICDNCKTDV